MKDDYDKFRDFCLSHQSDRQVSPQKVGAEPYPQTVTDTCRVMNNLHIPGMNINNYEDYFGPENICMYCEAKFREGMDSLKKVRGSLSFRANLVKAAEKEQTDHVFYNNIKRIQLGLFQEIQKRKQQAESDFIDIIFSFFDKDDIERIMNQDPEFILINKPTDIDRVRGIFSRLAPFYDINAIEKSLRQMPRFDVLVFVNRINERFKKEYQD